MSNRALRRAMNRQGSDSHNGKDTVSEDLSVGVKEDEESEEEKEESSQSQKKVNLFDLLALEDEDDDDGDNDVEATLCDGDEKSFGTEEGSTKPKKSSRKKNKKQKKNRGKTEAEKENGDSVNQNADQFDLDSYVKAVAEERKRMQAQEHESGAAAAGGHSYERSVLSVDHRWLDADYELARVFGKSFVRDEASKRVTGRMPGAGLVRPKARWPIASQIGLSMRKVDESEDDGGCWFIVEHNKEYRAVEEKFRDALHSHNPNNLQEILRRQPYHVNTLLQMCDVFRMEEDYDMAADIAERAVFAFTRSTHPLFNVPSGRCLLGYRYEENRGFFIALFLHIQFLARRGCYRTALEFCKVLLNLNPKQDPLAAILMIDHLAIMSGELEYLLQFFNEWQGYKNLNQLPNFMFSCALAHLRLNEKCGNGDDGKLMLQDALLRYPGWLPRLLEKCDVKPDDRVANSQFFHRDSSDTEGLIRLYDLHIGRTFHCWKEPDTLHWLETCVSSVLDIVEAGQDKRIKEYADYRSRRYQNTPKSVLRHIFLSSIPGVTFSMPRSMESTSLAIFDPLPPKDSISLYPRPVRRRRAEMDSGFLAPFLNSMLPTYDPQEERPDGARGAHANRADEIWETMRQLLAGIRPNPPPVANEHDVEDVEEE